MLLHNPSTPTHCAGQGQREKAQRFAEQFGHSKQQQKRRRTSKEREASLGHEVGTVGGGYIDDGSSSEKPVAAGNQQDAKTKFEEQCVLLTVTTEAETRGGQQNRKNFN